MADMNEPTSTMFNVALVLDRLAKSVPASLYCLGGAFLVVKFLGFSAAAPVWLLVALAAAGAVGWAAAPLLAGGGWYSADYARAWMDLRNHAGGSIISGESSDVKCPVVPGLSPRYMLRNTLLPLLFPFAAWLVPAPSPSAAVSGAGVEREVARVEREVNDAEERGALAVPDAAELHERIRRIRELADNSPEAAAEAANMLPARFEAAQARRLDQFSDAMDKAAAAAREMADPSAASAAGDAAGDRAAGELFDALDRLVAAEGGMDNLPPELAQAIADAMKESGANSLKDMSGTGSGQAMSAESLEKILDALAQSGNNLAGSYQALDGGEAASQGMPAVSQALEGMMRSMGQMPGQGEGESGEAGTEMGSGGVDRGPGDAPLVLGNESKQAGERFSHPLPSGPPSLPSQMIRRERLAPEEAMPPEEFRPSWRGAVDVPDSVVAGEGGAVLGPERARAAEQYFKNLGGDSGQRQ